jgi:hypothetical protein
MPGKLASPTLLLLYSSLSAQSSSVIHSVWSIFLHSLRNETVINHLFYDSKKSLHCNKQKLSCLLCLLRVLRKTLHKYHGNYIFVVIFDKVSGVPIGNKINE